MEANMPVLTENPTPMTKTEGLILEALQKMNDRVNKMEEKRDQDTASVDTGSSWHKPASEDL